MKRDPFTCLKGENVYKHPTKMYTFRSWKCANSLLK